MYANQKKMLRNGEHLRFGMPLGKDLIQADR